MTRTLVIGVAIATLLSIGMVFATAFKAEAGCTRVYTTSGWVTRCK